MASTPADRLVGIYLSTRTVVQEPAYVDALQRDAGLNQVILMGGFSLSPAVAATNPLGEPGKGPGFSWDVDGSPLARAVDLLHQRGIKAWLLLGGWQIGAERYPSLVARDMWGYPLTDYQPLPYCSEQRSLTFCPSDETISDFYAAAYSDVVRQYPVDGIDVTHARYTSPAFWPSVFSCACDRCGRLAESLGHDWVRLKVECLAAVSALQKVDAKALRRFAAHSAGLGDLLQALVGHGSVLEWLDFRAEVIARSLRRFHTAVHRAVNRPIVFGVDNFPPSVALFAGHRYADFMTACDFTSPLLSHPAYFVLAVIQSWAYTLMTWAPGLDESDAIEVVGRVLGFDEVPLPKQLARLGTGLPASEPEVPGLEELVRHDLAKSRLYNTGAVPSYPVLMGGLWSAETVRRLTEAAWELGHDGVIYQESGELTSYVPEGFNVH